MKTILAVLSHPLAFLAGVTFFVIRVVDACGWTPATVSMAGAAALMGLYLLWLKLGVFRIRRRIKRIEQRMRDKEREFAFRVRSKWPGEFDDIPDHIISISSSIGSIREQWAEGNEPDGDQLRYLREWTAEVEAWKASMRSV